MSNSWAFVYCPNVRCKASQSSPNGEAWRYVHRGPQNCTKCHYAFILAEGRIRNKTGAWKEERASRDIRKAEDKETAERVQFIPADAGAIRKWLLKQNKDQAKDESILAAVDKLVPEKALSDEERTEMLRKQLEKAETSHVHESKVYSDQHAALLQRAQELCDYEQRVEAQKAKAEDSKQRMERAQAELDKHLASAAPPRNAADGDVITRLVTRTLAAGLSQHALDANVGRTVAQSMAELANNAEFLAAIGAGIQGGRSQQQSQQQNQQQSLPSQQSLPPPATPPPAASVSMEQLQHLDDEHQLLQCQQLVSHRIQQVQQQKQEQASIQALQQEAQHQKQQAEEQQRQMQEQEGLRKEKESHHQQQLSDAASGNAMQTDSSDRVRSRHERDREEDIIFDGDDHDDDSGLLQESKRRMLPADDDPGRTQCGSLASDDSLAAAKRITGKLGVSATVQGVMQTVLGGGSSGPVQQSS